MRVEIKQLTVVENRPQWKPLPAKALVGQSVVDYMLTTEHQVIAALFKDDVAVAFVSNHTSLVDKYAERGVSLHVQTLKDLLGTATVPAVTAEEFGGEIVGIKTLPKAS